MRLDPGGMIPDLRIGIDFGGTKIEVIALDRAGATLVRRRIPNPGNYDAAVRAIAGLVTGAESEIGRSGTVGMGIPGAISPATGLIRNANTTWLNNRPLHLDLGAALARDIRVENDANCFALSEATDGAAAGLGVVFGVILGTGCGGGIVVGGKVLSGLHRIAGEWGHTPLPWPTPQDVPQACFCGNHNCIEQYCSGPALAADFYGPGARDASAIQGLADGGNPFAAAALARHAERTGRALAVVVNILDPDAIVLGGGLSSHPHLYADMPAILARHVIADAPRTPVLKNLHGDSSGVRGAAWLWGR